MGHLVNQPNPISHYGLDWHDLNLDSGTFCVGSKEKTHKILDVERYIEQWPLIPVAELHASNARHPDDISMRWSYIPAASSANNQCLTPMALYHLQARFGQTLASADTQTPMWMRKSCVDHLRARHPKVTPLALANCMF